MNRGYVTKSLHLFAEAAVMSTVEAPLVEFITHHWLWQGFQEDQQSLGYRVVTTNYING